ncbi:MAG TPA: hypothetical protein VHD61_07500 [Lacunisphaera sp.]|nr:hypothetical protein [Lacunisphaera sp.]
MSGWRQLPGEKLLCAGAAAAMILSFAWTWSEAPRMRRLKSLPVGIRLGAARYAPGVSARSEAISHEWTGLAPDPSTGWSHEVFTPPEIYYDAGSRGFIVKSPAGGTMPEPAFGLELLAVKAEPYRLQLAGYFGGPGGYVGAFVSPGRPGGILARPGQRVAGLGLVVSSVAPKRAPAPDLEPMAEAVVHDEISGVDVVLESRTRKLTDNPVAVVKAAWADHETHELRTGDSLTSEGATFCVERIQLDPPEVLISEHIAGRPDATMHVLHPSATDAGPVGLAASGSATGQPAASIAAIAK